MSGNLQKYTAFLEVSKFKNMSHAADSMNISQPSISKMISDLEKEWGVPLFNRSRRGVTLTPDGERILPFVKRICDCERSIQNVIDEIKGIENGIIKIGSFSSVATHIIPNLTSKFKKKYNNVDFEILLGNYTEVEEWVISGRVDFGFVKQSDNPQLQYIPIYRDQIRAVLPQNHRLSKQDIVSIKDFENEDFILLEKNKNTEISDFLAQYNISPEIKYTLWDDYAIMSMVESNMGISILHDLVLKRIPYCICVKPIDVQPYRDICLIKSKNKEMPVAASKMLSMIVNDLSSEHTDKTEPSVQKKNI